MCDHSDYIQQFHQNILLYMDYRNKDRYSYFHVYASYCVDLCQKISGYLDRVHKLEWYYLIPQIILSLWICLAMNAPQCAMLAQHYKGLRLLNQDR